MERNQEIDGGKLDNYITGLHDPYAPFNRDVERLNKWRDVEEIDPIEWYCSPCFGLERECKGCLR